MKTVILKYLHLAIPGLIISIFFADPVYAQKNPADSLDYFVRTATRSVWLSNFTYDTIAHYSYIVLYDEKAELDSIIVSDPVAPDSFFLDDEELSELTNHFQKIDTALNLDLKSAAIFVPVLLIPYFDYYKINLDRDDRKTLYTEWLNTFSVFDSSLLSNYRLRHVVPVLITVSRRVN